MLEWIKAMCAAALFAFWGGPFHL